MSAGVQDQILAAIGFARRTGAPLLCCLIGAHRLSEHGAAIGLSYAGEAVTGPTELGVLADLSLGIPVRAQYGLDARLVTMSMDFALSTAFPSPTTVRIIPELPSTVASPLGVHVSSAQVGNSAFKEDDAQPGRCSAAFVVRGRGLPRLPWETGERPGPSDRVSTDQLAPDEQQILDTVSTSPLPPATALLQAATTYDDGGLSLRPSPVMANRAGVVQGGVLFGFATTACLSAESPAEFAAHVDFIRPATTDHEICAAVTVLKASARQQLSRVDLTQRGELMATASVRSTKA